MSRKGHSKSPYRLVPVPDASNIYVLMRGASHCRGAAIEGSGEEFYDLAQAIRARRPFTADRCGVNFTLMPLYGFAILYSPRNTMKNQGEEVPEHLLNPLVEAIEEGLRQGGFRFPRRNP